MINSYKYEMSKPAEQGKDLYIHADVVLCGANTREDFYSLGTLNIVEYSFGKCIEWKPVEDSVVLEHQDQDAEWSLVDIHTRTRTSSESTDSLGRTRNVRILFSELKSFHVNHNEQLILRQRDATTHVAFFELSNAESFINSLKRFIKFVKSRMDKNLYLVMGQVQPVLNKSFAELDLFQENTSDCVWKSVKNLHDHPYETTMQAFSKLANILSKEPVKRPVEETVADLLNGSHTIDPQPPMSVSVGSGDEYEVIGMGTDLPSRPPCPRGALLTPEQWEISKDSERRMTSPEADIFNQDAESENKRALVMLYAGRGSHRTVEDKKKVKMTCQMGMERLSTLQDDVTRIRNICILAHVDHGKTTLADSLVASNGIISNKLAGKLRYLDSRPDEQLRGITMKSSSITLHHVYKEEEYLINLIDSPGHVDFSSEVSTAVRLSDGAFIVVDVVEGVCPQTRSVLYVSYVEGLKPILILNKIDRLITEMKLTPLDAYVRLTQILEQVNAVMGEIFASDIMEREDREEVVSTGNKANERDLTDWQSGLEEIDDSSLYFSPEQGNVLFASAYDGWGFGIKEFAKIYAIKLGFSEKVLSKTLWGDFYINNKTKRIMKGAQEKAKKPLFVQLILDNIWVLYDTLVIRKDKGKLSHMAEKLNIKLTTRDLRLTDPKTQLRAICSQWLPLARACIDMVCEVVPSPNNLSSEKVERLLSGNNDFRTLPPETQQLKSAFLACSPSRTAPTVVFVSKMFPVDSDMLPENRPKPLTSEELAEKKEIARQRHAERMLQGLAADQRESTQEAATNNNGVMHDDVEDDAGEKPDSALVAFARVYSGTIQIGDTIHVLGPKYDPRVALERAEGGEWVDPTLVLRDLPALPGRYITMVTVERLYLLMGKELVSVDHVPAGNVFGIGGLEEHVLKTATLSTTIACPSFTELTSLAVPILRVALQPKRAKDLSTLIEGLKLLNQADACAVIHTQSTGEIVLSTAGEVHLERCLEDLKLRYAKVDINVSKPIVPHRETIVPPPKLDMMNEAIEKKTEEVSLEVWTPSRQCWFEIDAKPLPANITKVLEENAGLIKSLVSCYNPNDGTTNYRQDAHLLNDCRGIIDSPVSGKTGLQQKGIAAFKSELQAAFAEAGWQDEFDKIWSFGPRNCGLNILLNATDYKHKSIWEPCALGDDPRTPYDNGVINGFQMATQAGPLCEESMMGVCFIVKRWQMCCLPQGEYCAQSRGHLNGQIISTFKDACRRIFNMRRPRLVTPMYSCNVLVNSDVLGKLYAVFGKRQGRIVSADSAHGFGGHFRVLAVLPVQESFNLASELRTQTSGLASPQLVFSHWELMEQDPFWVPSTEEEYLHFGEKADCGNRAKSYMDAIRRRKGLPVDSQLVTHAEKQRTLSKKK